jgi:hypothetical protein
MFFFYLPIEVNHKLQKYFRINFIFDTQLFSWKQVIASSPKSDITTASLKNTRENFKLNFCHILVFVFRDILMASNAF